MCLQFLLTRVVGMQPRRRIGPSDLSRRFLYNNCVISRSPRREMGDNTNLPMTPGLLSTNAR